MGSGLWATKVHAPCLSDNPNVSFVGVWARDLTRSFTLAEQFGVQSFQCYEELLASTDSVSFAIAPVGPAELAPQALARGRHVLLEKPVATVVEQVRGMAAQLVPGQRAAVFLTRFSILVGLSGSRA